MVIPSSLQYLSLALIWLATIYVLMRDSLLMLPWSPLGLHINAGNELNIIRKDGRILDELSLDEDSVVTPLLTIIHYRTHSIAWHQRLFAPRLIILPDSADTEDFRQLRVWLLWGQKRKQR
jgi:toxin CptA